MSLSKGNNFDAHIYTGTVIKNKMGDYRKGLASTFNHILIIIGILVHFLLLKGQWSGADILLVTSSAFQKNDAAIWEDNMTNRSQDFTKKQF